MVRTRWLVLSLGVVLGLVVPAAHPSPAASVVVEPRTESFLHVVGRDYRDAAQGELWARPEDEVRLSGSATQVKVAVVPAGHSSPELEVVLWAPHGAELLRGVYTDAIDSSEASTYQEHRPRVRVHGSSCRVVDGQFEIFEIDLSQDRFSMAFHFECRSSSPVFGQVALNQPRDDSGLSIAPSRVTWPAQYTSVPERDVTVRVRNPGAAAVTLDEVSVSEGAEAFSVVGHDCATLAAGESCEVVVGFEPAAAGPVLGTLILRDSTTGVAAQVPLSGAGIPGVTGMRLRSEAGEPMGGGEDHLVPPLAVSASGEDDYVSVLMSDWYAAFWAPGGHVLAAGQEFTSTPDEPLMNVRREGVAGCEKAHGRFSVRDAAYAASGEVRRLNVDFIYACGGPDAPRLHGSVAYRSKLGLSPSPPRVHLEVAEHPFEYGGRLPVTITLDDSVAGREIRVFASARGMWTALGTVTVAGGTTVTRLVDVPRMTSTVMLRGADVDGNVASDRDLARVAPKLTVRLLDATDRTGRYTAYPVDGVATARVAMEPATNRPVKVRLQRRTPSGDWRRAGEPFWVTLRRGAATLELPSRPALRNVPLRVRVEYPVGSSLFAPTSSGWRHVVFGVRDG